MFPVPFVFARKTLPSTSKPNESSTSAPVTLVLPSSRQASEIGVHALMRRGRTASNVAATLSAVDAESCVISFSGASTSTSVPSLSRISRDVMMSCSVASLRGL
jgi:hypothetical protein